MAITIPNFGELSEEQIKQLLLLLMEYTSLHDSLNETVQDAYSAYIHDSLGTPPQKVLSQDAHDIYRFFKEHIDNSCLIIQDLMLKRCRESIKSAESQRKTK